MFGAAGSCDRGRPRSVLVLAMLQLEAVVKKAYNEPT